MIVGIDVGQKNLGVCVWDPQRSVITYWAVWTLPGTWAKDVWGALTEHATDAFLEGVEKAVIEHQPSKNPTMVRIMHYLECFFVSKHVPVALQDSKHKLLYASTTPWFPKDNTDREWTYATRKKLAVHTVSAFVTDTQQPLRTVFESSKKKDDLADAALHAMAHTVFGVLGVNRAREAPQKPKKIIARAPTAKQRRTGRLSAHNVKYLLRDVVDPAEIGDALKADPQLQRALKKHFGSVQTYLEAIHSTL